MKASEYKFEPCLLFFNFTKNFNECFGLHGFCIMLYVVNYNHSHLVAYKASIIGFNYFNYIDSISYVLYASMKIPWL